MHPFWPQLNLAMLFGQKSRIPAKEEADPVDVDQSAPLALNETEAGAVRNDYSDDGQVLRYRVIRPVPEASTIPSSIIFLRSRLAVAVDTFLQTSR